MSGTGKSTALAELGRRGFRVVDTDAPWTEWSEADGGYVWLAVPNAASNSASRPGLTSRTACSVTTRASSQVQRSYTRPRSYTRGYTHGGMVTPDEGH
jgi:hypothetical protein